MSRLNVERMMAALSEILSEKHGVKVTVTARKKERDVNGNAVH